METPDILYMKCCVLVNNIPDDIGDTLLKEDIKSIFMNSKKINYDMGHDNLYKAGIDVKENYINTHDETLQEQIIPSGSWIQVLEITYKPLIDQLWPQRNQWGVSLRNELGEGFVLYDPTANPNGRIAYNNIENKNKLQPSSISFTQNPANGYYAEIMTPTQYTAKQKTIPIKEENATNNTGDNMVQENQTQENNTQENNESEVGFLRGLISNYFHTAKESAAITAPVQQPLATNDVDMEEFIKANIAFHNSIPETNKLVAKISESQAEQVDAMTALQTEIKEVKIINSEQKQKLQELQDEIKVLQSRVAPEEKPEEEEEDEKPGEEVAAEEEKPEEQEQEQEKEGEEKPEEGAQQDGNVNEAEPDKGEADTKGNQTEPEPKPHTAKDSFTRVNSKQDAFNSQREVMLKFLSKRGYEELLKQ